MYYTIICPFDRLEYAAFFPLSYLIQDGKDCETGPSASSGVGQLNTRSEKTGRFIFTNVLLGVSVVDCMSSLRNLSLS
jgi:hypothetical protein